MASRYDINREFFHNYTAESLYWAGFIAADGCISGNRLRICLSSKDHGHLLKFKNCVGFSGPIHIRHDKYSTTNFAIRSDRICDGLATFNIGGAKSLTYTMPQWLIDHKLLNHFLRGYSDGDGSFFIRRQHITPTLYYKICGTEAFLIQFRSIMGRNKIVLRSRIRSQSAIHTLESGGNRLVTKMREYLYKDACSNTTLDRKYNVAFADTFVDMPDSFHNVPVEGISVLTGERILFESMKHAAQAGFDQPSISKCCSGKANTHKGFTWRKSNGA